NYLSQRTSAIQTRTFDPIMIITLGLTHRSDLQLSLPYFVNSHEGASHHGFGDVALTLGYQVLKETLDNPWIPDLRVTIAEAFPTGRFENLNPALNGTDALGAGSFQTSLGATFQKLWHLAGVHFLRGRLNFTYAIPARVNLHGFNAYGGAADT